MKYFLNYQHQPKGAERPLDQGEPVKVEVDETEFALLPNVGDFVSIDNSLRDHTEAVNFSGRVKSRVFRYIVDSCLINIVIEETDDDWGQLVKE